MDTDGQRCRTTVRGSRNPCGPREGAGGAGGTQGACCRSPAPAPLGALALPASGRRGCCQEVGLQDGLEQGLLRGAWGPRSPRVKQAGAPPTELAIGLRGRLGGREEGGGERMFSCLKAGRGRARRTAQAPRRRPPRQRCDVRQVLWVLPSPAVRRTLMAKRFVRLREWT